MTLPDTEYEAAMERIIDEDPRFTLEGYEFVREALDFTVSALNRDDEGTRPQHVNGRELLAGIRDYALKQFGPMAASLLNRWNIQSTEDIGTMVFLMVEEGVLGRTDKDSIHDFSNGYDFEKTFVRPFLPVNRKSYGKKEN